MGSTLQDKKISHRVLFCKNLVLENSNLKGKVVLDIGASDSYWMSRVCLKKGAKKVIAIDPFIEKEVLREKFELFKADIFDSRVGRQKYDVIMMFDVLEHIPKNTEIKVMKRIKGLLKRNGRFYLSTPNDSVFFNITDPAWFFGHRHYSKNNLKKLVSRSGMTIINFGSVGGINESFRIIYFYVCKHLLRKRSVIYPNRLWKASSREFERDGKMTNWIIARIK